MWKVFCNFAITHCFRKKHKLHLLGINSVLAVNSGILLGYKTKGVSNNLDGESVLRNKLKRYE